MSYKIKCDFIEKLIEIDIARYFGAFTFLNGEFYYLENADEQMTGADLLSEDANAILIYMQAKVSEGLKTISKVKASSRKNRSFLEDIREYRHNLSLDQKEDYFLYFQLRKKAEHATDFQHNILMKYANTGFSHAFYIAPLLLKKDEYEKQFLSIPDFLLSPFYLDEYELVEKKWVSHFGFIPFLRNHISIVPHENVDTNEHYYAYSKHGTDVTWHSPEFINEKPTRLADTMVSIMRDFYNSKKKETLRSLATKLTQMPIFSDSQVNDNNAIDIITKHGQLLERQFGIKQLLYVQNRPL